VGATQRRRGGGSMKNSIKSTSVVKSITNWMAKATATGGPISTAQVETWASALSIAIDALEAREATLLQAEQKPKNRALDPVYIDRLLENATIVVARLAYLAMQAATRKELAEIDLSACAILDALEALARQGRAQDNHYHQDNHPDLGA
jgi:hypothetical protein